MPNTGKPSKDCHTCRKRRVKCTLERPECERCLRIGKKCPGYRDEQSLIFRNEDSTSLAGPSASRDRRRAKSKVDKSEALGDKEHQPASTTPTRMSSDWSYRGIKLSDMDPMVFSTSPSLPPSTMTLDDLSQYAIPLVLSLFSYEFENQRMFAQLQLLPDMLSQCPKDSPVMLCCEALGIAYLANRFSSFIGETTRDHAYGRALAATNTLVGDPELRQQDEASISVWLLSLYEVVTGPRCSAGSLSTLTWNIHAQGQIELLRLRGPNQLNTATGQSIFWLLTICTQVRSFITGEEYPPFIQDWLTASQDSLLPYSRRLTVLSSFASRSNLIGRRVLAALGNDDPQVASWTIKEIWEQILAAETTLCEALQEHASDGPADLHNVYVSNSYRAYHMRSLQRAFDLIQSSQARQNLDMDTTEADGMVSRIRTTVQDLTASTLSTVRVIMGEPSDSAFTAGQSSFSMPANATTGEERILSTIPSSTSASIRRTRPICWLDILKLLWPLRIICARKHLLHEEQVTFAESVLNRMSNHFGIRQALANYHMLDDTQSPQTDLHHGAE